MFTLSLLLTMPESEERQPHGHPDFRVSNKIFAALWPKEGGAVVKLSLPVQSELLKLSPHIFSANAWWHHGWTKVHLPKITASRFRKLVESAWRGVTAQVTRPAR
jgi:predicted DNA-binding protein (MmcQ/YjbR family)